MAWKRNHYQRLKFMYQHLQAKWLYTCARISSRVKRFGSISMWSKMPVLHLNRLKTIAKACMLLEYFFKKLCLLLAKQVSALNFQTLWRNVWKLRCSLGHMRLMTMQAPSLTKIYQRGWSLGTRLLSYPYSSCSVYQAVFFHMFICLSVTLYKAKKTDRGQG